MPVIIGPDGFLCSRDDPRLAFHAFLNETLLEQAREPRKSHEIAGTAVGRLKRTLPKEQLIALTMASLDRATWIADHAHEIANPDDWRHRLWTIRYHLYALRLPFTSAEMCRLIESGSGTAPPVARVAEYFQSHDLTPELSAALRHWREAYKARIGRNYKHVDVQNELQLLDMVLW